MGLRSGGETGNRADAYAVALGEVARPLTFGEALPRLLDLVRGEFRLTPHLDAFARAIYRPSWVRLMMRKRSSSALAEIIAMKPGPIGW